MKNNFQCIIYYINAVPVIDEPEAPLQGEIVRVIGLVKGHIPTQADVEYMAKDIPEFVQPGTVLVYSICLN